MKFRTRKHDLQSELAAVSSIVDKRKVDEIYSCVHLAKIDNQNLRVATASRDLMIQSVVKIDAGGGGTILGLGGNEASTSALDGNSLAVSAGKLYDLCKKLPDKIIELDYTSASQKVVVRCDSSRFTISCQEPTLFPSIKSPTEYSHKLPLRFFHGAIKNALPLIEEKEAPLVQYSGILILLEDKVLEIIATDGQRLAVWFTTMETEKTFRIILPKKVLSELTAILETASMPSLNLEITPNVVFINFGKYTYQSATLNGSFPNYKLVVDEVRNNNDTSFRINRNKLQQALERCLIFSGKEQGFGINFDFRSKELSLSAANNKGDSAFELVEAECPISLSLRINGEHINGFLSSVPQDDSIDMFVNPKNLLRPVYFRSQSDRNHIFIVQPMDISTGVSI